jgi:anti-sigma regulatory factor (Ser/Thr protein kinase)
VSDSSVTLRLPPRSDAASEARRTLRSVCPAAPHHLLYDAELLISEVVTNAVRHAHGMLTLAIQCDGHQLAVAVADDSPDLPVVRTSSTASIGGRGMQLVDRLAASWGCKQRPEGAGKVVWFRVTV